MTKRFINLCGVPTDDQFVFKLFERIDRVVKDFIVIKVHRTPNFGLFEDRVFSSALLQIQQKFLVLWPGPQ